MYHFLRRSDGASIVEFAIVIPVFLLFMFGIMEMGFIFWNLSALNYAVSQAARYAYLNPTSSNEQVATYAANQIPTVINKSFTVDMVPKSYVDIQGSMNYTFVFLPLGSITLKANTRQPLPPG
ncbi:MAG TPA: TadE family protein [Candidatus Nitrosotenuis sp.]|nr:TadE family protein [Candidatus Nitrosotenuis sp.]